MYSLLLKFILNDFSFSVINKKSTKALRQVDNLRRDGCFTITHCRAAFPNAAEKIDTKFILNVIARQCAHCRGNPFRYAINHLPQNGKNRFPRPKLRISLGMTGRQLNFYHRDEVGVNAG